MEALLGPTLVNRAGEKVTTAEALGGVSFIGVYFSASSRPDVRRPQRCNFVEGGLSPQRAETRTVGGGVTLQKTPLRVCIHCSAGANSSPA